MVSNKPDSMFRRFARDRSEMDQSTRFITIGLMACLIIFLGACSGPVSSQPSPEDDQAPENSLAITLTTPAYQLSKSSDGFDVIQVEDFSLSANPGEPALPIKIVSIALPPNVDQNNLVLQVVDYQLKDLEGKYNFKLIEGDIRSDGDQTSGELVDETPGEGVVRLLTPGQMRKWIFTKVEYSPFQFNSQTGSLSVVSAVQILFIYDLSSAEIDPDLMADDMMDDLAAETFINFETAKVWYQVED